MSRPGRHPAGGRSRLTDSDDSLTGSHEPGQAQTEEIEARVEMNHADGQKENSHSENPAGEKISENEFARMVNEFIEKYRSALVKLAK